MKLSINGNIIHRVFVDNKRIRRIILDNNEVFNDNTINVAVSTNEKCKYSIIPDSNNANSFCLKIFDISDTAVVNIGFDDTCDLTISSDEDDNISHEILSCDNNIIHNIETSSYRDFFKSNASGSSLTISLSELDTIQTEHLYTILLNNDGLYFSV